MNASIPILSAVIGAVVLLFGRKLFWLCVAAIGFAAGVTLASHIVSEPTALLQLTFAILLGFIGALLALFLQKLRSEERRVGKECRSWWWSEASKEKEEER